MCFERTFFGFVAEISLVVTLHLREKVESPLSGINAFEYKFLFLLSTITISHIKLKQTVVTTLS